MPYYFNSILNNSNLVTEAISAAFLAPVVGQILFGYLTSAWGGKSVVTITSVFAVLSMILLMLTTNFYLMVILLTLFAFFVFSIFPILIEYVKELTPESVSASSNSLVWGVGNTIGGAVGIGLFCLALQSPECFTRRFHVGSDPDRGCFCGYYTHTAKKSQDIHRLIPDLPLVLCT